MRHSATTILALTGMAAVLSIQATGAGAADRTKPEFPAFAFDGPARGQEIIARLAERLPEVARWYGAEPQEFRALLRREGSLWADRQGRLLYRCHDRVETSRTPSLFSIGGGLTTPPVVAPFPLNQTFVLHSRPGSAKVIYLDCNGHTTAGTAWNSYYGTSTIASAPLDTDGNPAVLTDTELAIIQQIWQRVAEDYAPFAVDVTTEDPGAAALTRSSSTDGQFGMRVVITSSALENVGGIAYVGAFDEVGDYHKPVFVFTAPCSNDPRAMAESASHEVGHTLGLYHDGTTTGIEYYNGQGIWAPIMGCGVAKDLTQWSKGEYANANNRQDDLLVIQSHGLAYRADDYGNTLATATAVAGPSLTVTGAIEQNTDIDVLRFATGAGAITLTVTPAPRGANLDIGASLVDASGTVLVWAAPTDSLGATITATVPAGTYYLAIEGVGTGDPLTGYSEYASLGQYSVSGQLVDAGTPPANAAPSACASATPAAGVAPLPVTFSSAGSTDADGTIASYSWDFGDGTSSTAANPVHTYSAAGTYTARLTVLDNAGATGQATVTIVVSPAPSPVLRVAAIDMAVTATKGKSFATATVLVVDGAGKPVSGATVSGLWTGVAKSTTSGTTGTDGKAKLTSAQVRKSGTMTFEVTGVSLAGCTYSASLNTETKDSIAVTL